MTDDIHPLDMPPARGLTRAFQLPDFIREDAELVALHQEIVDRLRGEADGMPMGTLSELLLERIAGFYVQIKYKENTATFSANQQKEFNTYWLDLNKEFSRQMAAQNDTLWDAKAGEIYKVVSEALDLVTDEDQKRAVRRHIQGELAARQI